jgi:hypothetical protein
VKVRPAAGGGRWAEISPERIRGWIDGFYSRHNGAAEYGLVLTGTSNGDTATIYPPPGLTDVTDIDTLLSRLMAPPRIGLLLARKGAAAVGIADGTTISTSKVERFHVQARTAAGGWSQQRYAGRRGNQADAATDKTTDMAVRVLLPYAPGVPHESDEAVSALVCGGDRPMIDTILTDRRLHPLVAARHPHLLDTPEPRLAVLQDAAVAARQVRILLVP